MVLDCNPPLVFQPTVSVARAPAFYSPVGGSIQPITALGRVTHQAVQTFARIEVEFRDVSLPETLRF
jgi:hypothetical protein